MIRHIVLFQLKSSLTEDFRKEVCRKFKSDIESLQEEICYIKEIHVGINANPSETYHICLESTFADFNDLEKYAKHPLHLQAAQQIRPYIEHRSCVDYEI